MTVVLILILAVTALPAMLNAARALLETLSAGGTDGDAAGPTVLRASCKTPHHEDCWRYAGRGSTYGCRELARKGA